MKPELRYETKEIRQANLGKECCLPDLLGETILQNQLEFRLDEEDEIYEGYGKRPNAYPYRQYNTYTRQLSLGKTKTAVLENQYLKAVFLPEYGGRLWELWDKEEGRNLLYTNDVLQFSNLAVRNAWFSGGVEWNIGIIGHNPFTTDALYTAQTETDRGEPVLRMYEYERVRKTAYQIDFWLEEESRFLNCRMRIVNESSDVIPMYWWSNIAVPEYDNGRIIVPADQAFTYADGAVYKADIPFVNGTDVTEYKNIEKSVDYFFDIPEESPKYIANVDNTGYGLIQISTKRLRSRKLFSWGNQDASDRWQEFLTDKAGRYVEIQAGLGKTQYGCIPMAPHTAWEWMEQYGAVWIPEEELCREHKERADYLTGEILKNGTWENLEKKLKNTRDMAKKRAKLILPGSGYGALEKRGKWTAHLEFCRKDSSLEAWKNFFETSVLHGPDPMEEPDAFFIHEGNLRFLEESMKGANQQNWYAHYHLGLGYYTAGEYFKAEEELKKSLELAANPWSLHALSCTCMVLGRKNEAAEYMVQGIQRKQKAVDYVKEGFKILILCEEYEKLCKCYERLGETEQSVGKIRFYYISALRYLGEYEKAFEFLEQNGGLLIEDIREGEDSVAMLWKELYRELYGQEGTVPHRYNFKAY